MSANIFFFRFSNIFFEFFLLGYIVQLCIIISNNLDVASSITTVCLLSSKRYVKKFADMIRIRKTPQSFCSSKTVEYVAYRTNAVNVIGVYSANISRSNFNYIISLSTKKNIYIFIYPKKKKRK